jgi:hypothetical protein
MKYFSGKRAAVPTRPYYWATAKKVTLAAQRDIARKTSIAARKRKGGGGKRQEEARRAGHVIALQHGPPWITGRT